MSTMNKGDSLKNIPSDANLTGEQSKTLLQSLRNVKKAEEKESPYKRKHYKIPEYLKAMTEIEKEQNHKIIQNMSKRINYLRNPRFKVDKAAITFDQVKAKKLESSIKNTTLDFRADPEEVVFRNYQINGIYEMTVSLCNVSPMSKRIKYMPPPTNEFTVTKVNYPLGRGQIAPGMSVVFVIHFHATNLSDFNDELIIVTDVGAFPQYYQIKLKARRHHPDITLPLTLQCQNCWLGDRSDMVFRFTNKGGEGGYRFFCQNEEDDEKQRGDFLKLNNFMIYPVEFYINPQEQQELFVCFIPKVAGIIEEKVIIACDNQTSKEIKLIGESNLLKLEIDKVNGKSINKEETHLFKNIIFDSSIPDVEQIKTIQISNKTTVEVIYHWAIFHEEKPQAQFDLANLKENNFEIFPAKGVFKPSSHIEFQIKFKASTPMPYYQYCSLIIDDIPFKSIINPPPAMITGKDDDPGYVGHNNMKPSLCFFEFKLTGVVNLRSIQVEPNYFKFPSALLIGKKYYKEFRIKNSSQGCCSFQIIQHCKSHDDLSVELDTYSYKLKENEEKIIQIEISSNLPGENKQACYLIEVENGKVFQFDITADFTEPTVRILAPNLNFGLNNIDTLKTISFQIQNVTDIPAEILFRPHNQSGFTFETHEEWSDVDLKAKQIYFDHTYYKLEPNEKKTINCRLMCGEPEEIDILYEMLVLHGESKLFQVKAIIQKAHICLNKILAKYRKIYAGREYELSTDKGNQIELKNLGNIPSHFKWSVLDCNENDFTVTFDPAEGIIPAKSKIDMKIHFTPYKGGDLSQLIVCDVEKLEQPLGFEITGQVFGLSVIFEKIPEKNAPKQKNITSKQSMQSSMKSGSSKWSSVSKSNRTVNVFAGLIKTDIEISEITLLNCKINEPQTYQFSIKNTSGIDTDYYFYYKKYEPLIRKDDVAMIAKPGSLSNMMRSVMNMSTMQIDKLKSKLITSGILAVEGEKPPIIDKRAILKKRQGQLLSDEIELANNFQSTGGRELIKNRLQKKDQRFYLINNLGMCMLTEPNRGVLKGKAEITITVTVYNDICGNFKDNLICEIQGLEPKNLPTHIIVSGSPVIIDQCQLGVDFKTDYPTLNLGSTITGVAPIQKQLRLLNTSPKPCEFTWKMYDLDKVPGTQKERKFFDLKIGGPKLGSTEICSLNFDPVQPEESTNGKFTFAPLSKKINGRKPAIFTIKFKSDETRSYNSVLIGKPNLLSGKKKNHHRELSQQSNSQNNDIGQVACYLKGRTFRPHLHLDKLLTLGGKEQVEFVRHALCHCDDEKQIVILTNKEKSNIITNVSIEGPFRLLKTETNSSLKHQFAYKMKNPQTQFNLSESSNLVLEIEFNPGKARNHEEWPLARKIYKHGKFVLSYANGDSQTVKLEGLCLRPVLSLNTIGFEGHLNPPIEEFGYVHINNKKTQIFYLSNTTPVPAKWKLHYVKFPKKKIISKITLTKMEMENMKIIDDPTVWEFSVTSGNFKGPTVPLNEISEDKVLLGGTCIGPTVPVNKVPESLVLPYQVTLDRMEQQQPQKIMVNFRPKLNIFYKSKFKIAVDEGPTITLTLRGHGTYEEHLEI